MITDNTTPTRTGFAPDQAPETAAGDRQLDITDQVCPMTFVRTKLVLEKMAPGEVLEVRLNRGEPLENVPRSVTEMGHEVLSLDPEPGGETFRLQIRLGER